MPRKTVFKTVRLSLADLLGEEHVEAVVDAAARLRGRPRREAARIARAKVDFFPKATQRRLVQLLDRIGRQVSRPLGCSPAGASTAAFDAAFRTGAAPVSAWGFYRVGEDGRLTFISKSEHYHTPVGHSFPGYGLIEHARRLGIPNATHNNTRGCITRRLEQELVRTANGVASGDQAGLRRCLRSRSRTVLNRVLNLQTGSLAAEAAVKMMLARFYRAEPGAPQPKYHGRTPVFVVVGDDEGGPTANYHGTTILTQWMRGMWPGMRSAVEAGGVMRIAPVRPDDIGGIEKIFRRFDRGRCKVAGFLHELVLMNYGARRLGERFVRRAYALCRAHDVPILADEIQSCLWSPRLYTFREYGLRPTFVAVGKGFPGGECPASRLLFSAAMDCLPQFGALVTNGQEELASLAYLITMRWAEANADVTAAVGDHYERALGRLVEGHPDVLAGVSGRRHLAGLRFHEIDRAKAFAASLVAAGFDISVQTYKASCPPVALTKLPLIAGFEAVDCLVEHMEAALSDGSAGRRLRR